MAAAPTPETALHRLPAERLTAVAPAGQAAAVASAQPAASLHSTSCCCRVVAAGAAVAGDTGCSVQAGRKYTAASSGAA